jgi:hypothetical protein
MPQQPCNISGGNDSIVGISGRKTAHFIVAAVLQ